MKIKLAIFAILVLALAVTGFGQITVYNAVPDTLAPNYASQAYQAQQTAEFGDYVHLDGTARNLRTVTVTMSNWATQASNTAVCAAHTELNCTAAGYDYPFTLNIYALSPTLLTGGVRNHGAVIATVTQTKTVPWRPADDLTHCPADSAWYSGGLCYHGYAFNMTFDMSGLNAVLPNDVIVGLYFNTQTWGDNPTLVAGPYTSLNMALPNSAPSVGTDDSSDKVFWRTATASRYTDGGVAGTGFREDTGWTGYGTLPIKITTAPDLCSTISAPTVNSLTGVSAAVQLSKADIGTCGVVSADFTLTYDYSKMHLSGTSWGAAWNAAGPSVTAYENPSGTVHVSIIGTSGTPEATSDPDFLHLTFSVVGPIGSSSPITLSDMLLNGGLVGTATNNGSLTVISGTISGTVTYTNTAIAVPGVTMTGNPGSITTPASTVRTGNTDSSGAYSLGGFGPAAYTVTPYKNYPGGTSTPAFGIMTDDATAIVRSIVGIDSPLTGVRLQAAKVSGTATPALSSFDAALIAQWIVGINNSINQTGHWKFTPANGGSFVVNANVTQNYTALLMGDVNQSWSNVAGAIPSPLDTNFEGARDTVRASLANAEAARGSVVTVPVRIDNLRGRSVGSYQFDIQYDPAVVEPTAKAADIGGTVGDSLNVVSNVVRPGLLKVAVYGAMPVTGDGVYMNLRFSTLGDANTRSPLSLRSFYFNDGRTFVATADGSISVTAAATTATIHGRVLSAYGQGIGSSRVILTSTKGQKVVTLSTPMGYFDFSGLDVGETYTVNVLAKRYTFSSRTVSVSDGVTELDMIADQ